MSPMRLLFALLLFAGAESCSNAARNGFRDVRPGDGRGGEAVDGEGSRLRNGLLEESKGEGPRSAHKGGGSAIWIESYLRGALT